MEITFNMALWQHIPVFQLGVRWSENITMQKHLILWVDAGERTIPPNPPTGLITLTSPVIYCVWFDCLSLSHTEHNLQIILQRNGSKTNSFCLTVITVSSYLCCVNRFCCCHRFQSSQKVVLQLKVPFSSCAFQKVFPKVGSKCFNCRILQGRDSQANVYFTHTSRFGLTFCTFPYCLFLKLKLNFIV